MTLVFISVFSLISCFNKARADDLIFDNIRLNELAKVTYSQILDNDLIMDDTFNADNKTLSVFLKNRSKNDISKAIDQIVLSAGYEVKRDGRMVKVVKPEIAKPVLSPFYYEPKYRSVSYLSDMVNNLFTTGSFTFNRAVKNAASKSSDTVDTGTTAFSQLSKPQDAFIFNGTVSEIKQLQSLLAVIDVPEKQAQITAYLFEVSNTDTKQTSFNLAASLLAGALKVNILGQALANSISYGSGNIQVGLSALAADTRFNVISSPAILVKNRQKGSFSVGSDVPVLGSVTYQNNGQPLQSIDYKQSGVILDIEPIFHDETIELTLYHQVSNFVLTNTGVNTSPTLIKRELKTVVNSKYEDIILLGGLNETHETKSKSGLPFLPALFHSKSVESSKSDILLLLHVKKI